MVDDRERRVVVESLDPTGPAADAGIAPGDELVALDEALDRLSQIDAITADVVKLRYFGGLTSDQIAEVVGAKLEGGVLRVRFKGKSS